MALQAIRLTSEYLPFKSASVKGFPSWSIRLKDPPTLGLPTVLFASAMRFFCMRSFSCSKYQIIPPAAMTNSSPAFQENG